MKRLPKSLKKYFWDVEFEKIDMYTNPVLPSTNQSVLLKR